MWEGASKLGRQKCANISHLAWTLKSADLTSLIVQHERNCALREVKTLSVTYRYDEHVSSCGRHGLKAGLACIYVCGTGNDVRDASPLARQGRFLSGRCDDGRPTGQLIHSGLTRDGDCDFVTAVPIDEGELNRFRRCG